MRPYYSDGSVTLYHGDMREIIPALNLAADCIVTDPPYGETSLTWDRWPDGWPSVAATSSRSMWCFGSMRMFMEQRDQLGLWQMSQDVVWEKHNGSGFAADRFKRVHEHAVHFYLGRWAETYHETPRELGGVGNKSVRKRGATPHTGVIGNAGYVDDGKRLVRSVIYCPSMQQKAIHPTEKPVGIIAPLIEYACPPGGTVLDFFAGSGSTGDAARLIGRKAVLVEASEQFCEAIAKRLSQGTLPMVGGVA